MISLKSFQPLEWSFRFLTLVHLMAGSWDTKQNRLLTLSETSSKTRMRICQMFEFALAVSNLVGILVLLLVIFLIEDIRPDEVLIGMFFMCTIVLSTAYERILGSKRFPLLVQLINGMFSLNRRHGTVCRVKSNDSVLNKPYRPD